MSAPGSTRASAAVAGALANIVIVAPLLWAAVVQSLSSSFYASSIQEDGILEWMTAWGFVAAAAVFAFAAYAEARKCRRFPWLSIGLALFCLLVALEEISWGQRLLGYRPPTYFLEHNFQQELNVHNLIDTSLRKLALKAIIVGYGVVLPLLARAESIRRLFRRCGVWAPPLALVPGFAVTAVTYEIYPLKYTGELVELMLAAAFLFSALSSPALEAVRETRTASRLTHPKKLLVGTLVVAILGLMSGAASARVRRAHPGNANAAQAETEALRRDLFTLARVNGGKHPTRCGLHRRVFTWVTKANATLLLGGTFASLQSQGLPEARASYFLDPWNSPYWIRHRCSSSRERIIVYSFGPNRRRDSDPWEVGGDDIGTIIDLAPPSEP